MIEDQQTPTDTKETELEKAGREAQEMSDATAEALFRKRLEDASQRLVEGKKGARLVRSTAIKLAATAATAAIVVPVAGNFVADSVDGYVKNLDAQNQQYINQEKQDQQKQDFENGLNNGKVTIETPAPTATPDLPSVDTSKPPSDPAGSNPDTIRINEQKQALATINNGHQPDVTNQSGDVPSPITH